MTDYNDVLNRIKNIYQSSSKSDQVILKRILEEIYNNGDSKTYEDIWLSDYKEIPVDKHTFLTHDRFLGSTNRNGKSIYPTWMDTMLELERTGNQYYEIVFTGATRTGKSSTAVSDSLYQLYRMMCLRDPQAYFGLKSTTEISFFFFNLTEKLAKGVAFREFNNTIFMSPWFLEHGTKSPSKEYPVYIPEGGLLKIKYGSDSSHALGQATACVVGNTEILTDSGYKRIEELVGVNNLAQYSDNDKIVYENSEVILTKYVNETIRIELYDGTVFEGTPEHRLLLSDMHYKALNELIIDDALFTVSGNANTKIRNIHTIKYANAIPVYDVMNAFPNNNFIVKSNSNLVAHNCVVFDEVNFSSSGIKDINKAKENMKAKYDTLVARVTGTFVRDGEVFGRIYVISSKNSDSDFMEEYIQKQREAGNKHMYIFDKPQWEVWPKSKYSSDRTFKIALGGKKLKSFVVQDDITEAGLVDLEKQGFKLIDVPEDNKTRFLSDFDIALRDIAGISVVGNLNYITYELLEPCIGDRRNPFFNDVLEIGVKDNLAIEEFFHIEVIPDNIKRAPLFIHLDLSLNTDRTGISGVAVTGRKDIESKDENTGEISKVSFPTFSHVFSIALEAPRGDKIPYSKIIAFISWLRRSGFDIQAITRDQFQSEYVGQELEAQGFGEIKKLSLDRTPDGYMALRSVIIEERIDLLHNELLEEELIHLQRDAATGKIDHLVGRSKDVADSLAGSVWNAIIVNPGVSIPSVNVSNIIRNINSPAMNNGITSVFPDMRYRGR